MSAPDSESGAVPATVVMAGEITLESAGDVIAVPGSVVSAGAATVKLVKPLV